MSITSKLKERNNATKEERKSFLKSLKKKNAWTLEKERDKRNRNIRYELAKCPCERVRIRENS